MIIVNGNEKEFYSTNLKNFLTDCGFSINLVACELNGHIIPKAQYENTLVNDGDTIEVVSFVGGG